jgi:hypothetical protein
MMYYHGKRQKKTFTVVAKIDGTCQKIPLTVTQTNGKWHLPSNLRSNIHTDSIYHCLPKWSKLLISLLYGEPTYGLNPGIWNLIHSLKIDPSKRQFSSCRLLFIFNLKKMMEHTIW